MSVPHHEPDEWADKWADPPDRWAEDDRAWKEKWTDKAQEASGDELEPPSTAYTPERASLKSVTDSYEEGMREAGPHLTIGIQIAASMLVFVAAGWALDNWAGTSPWGVLVGTALGFAGIMALVLRLANEANTKK